MTFHTNWRLLVLSNCTWKTTPIQLCSGITQVFIWFKHLFMATWNKNRKNKKVRLAVLHSTWLLSNVQLICKTTIYSSQFCEKKYSNVLQQTTCSEDKQSYLAMDLFHYFLCFLLYLSGDWGTYRLECNTCSGVGHWWIWYQVGHIGTGKVKYITWWWNCILLI